MTEQARKEFEAQAMVLAVKHYGYKEGDALLKSILERRANDRYMVDWVEGAWLGYQAATEAETVISIDQPDLDLMYERSLIEDRPPAFVVQMPDAHSYTVPDVAGAVILDCMTAIRKAGGEAKV